MQCDHIRWEHSWIASSLITKVQTKYCSSIFKASVLTLFSESPQTDTQQTVDNWVSPFSVQALLLLCNPCISWAAVAAAGQALPRAFHLFPSRSERDELWHEEDYALRQGFAGENTFNVLPYSRFHKRGDTDSVHGPCGLVSSLSLSLKTWSRSLWKMSHSKLPFASCSSALVAIICISTDSLSFEITWNQMLCFMACVETPSISFLGYLVSPSWTYINLMQTSPTFPSALFSVLLKPCITVGRLPSLLWKTPVDFICTGAAPSTEED